MDTDVFKQCSTCKQGIAFGVSYYVCSVSTCNRKATDFTFCSVACWDAHVPVYRHRDAWAEDRDAPTRAQAQVAAQQATTQAAVRAAAHAERADAAREPTPIRETGPIPNDVLVIASKMKAYVRARSGMNTSDGVLPVLSGKLRALCDDAIERASQAGRKTILDRDF